MTRALIADDEPLMREQLRARLSELWPELEVVAEAKNGVEAVEQVAALRPEVVFLDIRMPAKTGIEARKTTSRSEEHTSELQSRFDLVCRLLLEKKKTKTNNTHRISKLLTPTYRL